MDTLKGRDMLTGIKIYNIKSFVRKKEVGDLSRARVSEIIREIVNIAICFPEKNILLDFRETSLAQDVKMTDAMNLAIEASTFGKGMINKIASLIPEDVKRASAAEKVRVAMQFKGINFRYFTSFEEAIEWLSCDRPKPD